MNKRIGLFIILGVGILLLFFAIIKGKMGARADGPNATPVSRSSAKEVQKLFDQARQLREDNQKIEAKQLLQDTLVRYSDAENIETVQNELGALNLDIILSTIMIPNKSVMHEVVPGDTIGKIAEKYGTTIEMIKKSNRLKSDIIQLGQNLRVWTGKFNILVDKSQNVLIVRDDNEVIKVYNVSTGENNSTPVGTFVITTRLIDPVWFNKGAIVPPESDENVLGTRWLGFDLPGYGIHGTVEEETIGQQVTAGCVRMRNREVEELFDLIPRGTKVTVVD